PLLNYYGIHAHVQAGTDYKTYSDVNYETNLFTFVQNLVSTSGQPFTRVTTTPSPVPTARHYIAYLPLTLHFDPYRDDGTGNTSFGVNYAANLWHSGNGTGIQGVAGSAKASAYWSVFSGSVGREQSLPGGWKLSLRGDGQWADSPLIGNEQFGAG